MPGTEIRVFDKIVRVIELLATSSQEVTLKRVQESLGLSKGTAFRILRALETHRLAAKNDDGIFVLGSRVLWWEACYRQNRGVSRLVRPQLERLRDMTSETAAFSIMVGDQSVVVDQAMSRHATSTRFDIGFAAPLHAGASGRVMLAHLPPERKRDFLNQRLERFTDRTITDKRRLEQELNQYLAQGFAFGEGERLADTSSIAAPIFGPEREVLGVISVTGPSSRLTRTRCKSIAPKLKKITRLLTERLNQG